MADDKKTGKEYEKDDSNKPEDKNNPNPEAQKLKKCRLCGHQKHGPNPRCSGM